MQVWRAIVPFAQELTIAADRVAVEVFASERSRRLVTIRLKGWGDSYPERLLTTIRSRLEASRRSWKGDRLVRHVSFHAVEPADEEPFEVDHPGKLCLILVLHRGQTSELDDGGPAIAQISHQPDRA